jgi:hypothetical protein
MMKPGLTFRFWKVGLYFCVFLPGGWLVTRD